MKKGLRIGAVPYLNTKPLVAGIEGGRGVELRLAVPSQLPDLLEQGELDVALIPSIEYLRGRPFFVVPDTSIASRGAVESVLLFLRVPSVRDIKRVALDESSLTSAALVRIILQERYGLRLSSVEYVPWPRNQDLNDTQADAVLVIGDNAMKMASRMRNAECSKCGFRIAECGIKTTPHSAFPIPHSERTPHSLDLGAEWKALTGLPFVYALWGTSKKGLVDSARRLLNEAKRKGLAALPEIARREAKRLGLEPGFCLRYLSENICYELGEAEVAGLRQFYRYALSMGLASEGVNLDFGNKTHIREGTLQGTDSTRGGPGPHLL
ncbi:MAG TPA: menaquinone biosynthetic enzyme MqnA/MqnD family protein [Candidatus Tripitaka californicus]|uniref:menaquinone biosynthetic enzyme MqnA/MqnD family protein n=1 Tax=Candidatus Tripitaka californicus TaxID=3367616 RepID=UPI00402650B8